MARSLLSRREVEEQASPRLLRMKARRPGILTGLVACRHRRRRHAADQRLAASVLRAAWRWITPAVPPFSLLPRLPGLLGTRGGVAYVLGLLVVAVVLCFLPLAGHLGFEFAAILAIASVFLAPAVGISAMRRELDRTSPARGQAAASAGLFAVVALVVPTAVILLNGLRRPPCEPWQGAVWLLVLSAPSAWLSATVGALARTRTTSARGAALWVGMLVAASLGVGLHSIHAGPAFFLFDHFLGYFPGPLYDEVVPVSRTLLIFRGLTVLWGVAAVAMCAAHGIGPLAERGRRAAVWLVVLLVSTSLFAGTKLGFRTTDASLANDLGGVRQVESLELHFPKEWSDEKVERFTRDVVFRAAQVEDALGVKPEGPVRVWMYRNAEEKRRLVGAAATSFAKPWRREIHIHDSGFPHPVLRHELVHAVAGDIARGPFRVPGGLIPNSPLIEGLAVAFDTEPQGMTLAQWAKAMRELGVAPDLTALLSSTGFLSAAPARAYTYAGAFLRHLSEQFGREKVLELYASGRLSELGTPLELVADFEAALDSVSIGPEERAAAERRYARPSVFRRRCAREVSQLSQEARASMRSGDPVAAVALYERACELEPDDPVHVRSLLTAALSAKDEERAGRAEETLFAHPKLDASLRAAALIELGDVEWKRGDVTAAARRIAAAAELPVDPGTRRSAIARQLALESPERAEALRPLFADGNTGIDQLFRMNDHLVANPDDGLVAYLLGRQLVSRGARTRGVELLEMADAAGLNDRAMSLENLRLIVRAQAERHRCTQASVASDRLAELGNGADRAYGADWVERCRFESARGWSALDDD